MRIGVLGGSFNPPHNGHVVVASDAFEALALDKLYVIPAHANPLKGIGSEGASARQRFDMVNLAFGSDPRFEVSDMEIDRGGLSFTVDTLEALARKHPGAELMLLLGVDSLASMEKWRNPGRIRELATLAALARGGPENSARKAGEGVEVVTTRQVEMSSSEIRARLAAGKPVRGFVAESVERYIAAAKLYGPRADG